MKNNNKGFSMIELLIVIAILSVAAAGSVLSMSIARNADVKKAAVQTEALMKGVRSNCMAKSAAEYLYLYNDGDDVYYVISSDKADNYTAVSGLNGKTKLCSGSITVTCSTKTSSKNLVNDFVRISFDKSTGGVIYDGGDLSEISFSRSSKESKVIVAYETGKTTVNNG